jgi:hypothetical protein
VVIFVLLLIVVIVVGISWGPRVADKILLVGVRLSYHRVIFTIVFLVIVVVVVIFIAGIPWGQRVVDEGQHGEKVLEDPRDHVSLRLTH